jgi:hypothetical protein
MEAFTSSSVHRVASRHDIESLGSEEASSPVIQAHLVNESVVEGVPVEPERMEPSPSEPPGREESFPPYRINRWLLVAVVVMMVVILVIVLAFVLKSDPNPSPAVTSPTDNSVAPITVAPTSVTPSPTASLPTLEPTSTPTPTRTSPPAFHVPFTANALSFSDFFEVSEKQWGDCQNHTGMWTWISVGEDYIVDTEFTTDDEVCFSTGPCHIAYMEPGEWLEYDFLTNSGDNTTLSNGTQGILVDITVRVASLSVKVFVSTYYGYTE